MKISQKQFKHLLQQNKLVLSLIGMSNIGKTYWSKKLAELNFQHFNCDDLIETKLAPLLRARGYSGIKDVSRWMGQPYNKRFSENQQKFLELEAEIIKNILAKLKNIRKNNIVIDTTGSVVHLGSSICSLLKKHTLVIYLEATDYLREDMFRSYIKDPKPVVFGNIFRPKNGETHKQSLRRCYQKLLTKRSRLYAKYADIVIPRKSLGKNIDTMKFLSLIKKNSRYA
ncbi:MAG: shikimate kinase [Patescibacteria group bacterium]